MISREFTGIILIAIVFSTVLTLMIIGERPEKPVEIIRNDAPGLNSGSDQKYGYAFTIVLREDFDEVRVKFSWLRGMPMLLTGGTTGESIESVLPNFLKIQMLDEFLARFQAKPEQVRHDTFIEGWPGGDEVLFLDYSEPLSAGMTDQTPWVHPVFLFVLNDGQITGYYEGIADFFPEREWRFPTARKPKPPRDPRSSGSIEFGLDENRTKYVSAGEKRLFPELPTLDELPPYGQLVFKDVKKDQRLTVLTFFYGRSLGYGWQRELIRVYVDGKLELVQIN